MFLLQQALDIFERAYPPTHPRVASARAESILREVVERYAKISPDHLNTGLARIKLGRTLLQQQRYREAEAQILAGYEIAMKQTNPSVVWLQDARKDLVTIYEALNEPEKAARFR